MKKILLSTSFIACAVAANAQRYIGVSTDAYNTINSMYLNPANLAGCNEKISVNMLGVNIGVDNNLGTLTSISDIGKTTSGDSGISIFKATGTSGKFSMMAPGIDVRGPSIIYRINQKHTVALSTRLRAINEFNNFDKALYTSLNNPQGVNTSFISFQAQNFNWTAHVWSEIGLSYGGEVYSNDMISVKVGATVRYLGGIGYLGIKGKNMDVTYTSANDSFRANNTDIEYASNIQTLSEGFSNGISASRLFGGKEGGSGVGADLGAIAEYKKDDETEKYTARLSLSVTDLGAISYKNSSDVMITGNGYMKGDQIGDSVKSYNDLRAYAGRRGFTVDTGRKSQKVSLPTTLVIGADYHAWNKVFVSALVIANMAGDANFGSKYYSSISLIPRWQSKIFTASLPLTYNTLAHNMRVGLGLRLGGLYVGSDDMLGIFSNNQYGFNMYVGGMIPIYREPKNTAN